MKPLIEHGHLFIACPPLYRVYKDRKEIYCYDDEELKAAKTKIGNGYRIQRYKGLGEMLYNQLSETTMKKDKRKLLQVKITDDDECSDKVNLFLGKDTDRRKEWIENNIDFTVKDAFTMEVSDEKEN